MKGGMMIRYGATALGETLWLLVGQHELSRRGWMFDIAQQPSRRTIVVGMVATNLNTIADERLLVVRNQDVTLKFTTIYFV